MKPEVLDFRLKGSDSRTYWMDLYRDAELLVFVFLKNDSSTCLNYADRIRAIQRDFEVKFIRVIGINSHDDLTSMKKISSEYNFNFPYLSDPEKKLARHFHIQGVPEVVIYNPKTGGVVYQGAIDDSPKDATKAKHAYVRKALTELMKQVPLPYEKAVPQMDQASL